MASDCRQEGRLLSQRFQKLKLMKTVVKLLSGLRQATQSDLNVFALCMPVSGQKHFIVSVNRKAVAVKSVSADSHDEINAQI